MIGEIVSSLRQVMDIRFNEISMTLNRALKSSNPTVAAECLLDSIRNDAKSIDGSFRDRNVSSLLGSEGDGHLFLLLGQSYYDGNVKGRRDFPRAARYLHAAYTQGYTMAALYLGNLFYYGNGVELNYTTAFGYYKVGAQSGDAAAMSCLGWMYAFGCGVEVNGRLAVKWLNEAARKGNPLGLWLSGYYALHGNATCQNFPKAVSYMKAALKAGEHRASNELGLCYLNGIGVDRDVGKAVELWRRAYESTDGETTTFWLATYYEGVEKNYVQAARLYKELAEYGTQHARKFGCFSAAVSYSDWV